MTIIRLEETPKFLLAEGKDEEAVRVLQNIARKHARPCSLTAERLAACGSTRLRATTATGLSQRLISPREVGFHFKGLYATRKMAFSTTLVWFSWLLIGLAYPLYNVFLPTYLASRGASFGETSPYTTWRNYAINNTCGIFGPVLAGFMCRSPWFWGRRGTMIIGAVVTMVFLFCYTQVRTAGQNLGFTCAISFCLNIYYGTLYAYTPEVRAFRAKVLSLFHSNVGRYFRRVIEELAMESPLDLIGSWASSARWLAKLLMQVHTAF